MVLAWAVWENVRKRGECYHGSGTDALGSRAPAGWMLVCFWDGCYGKGSGPKHNCSQSHLSYVGQGAVLSRRTSG